MLAVRLIRGFFQFWYDFIIGDCWEIAAGVVVVLAGGVLLVKREAVPTDVLPFLMAAAVMLLLVLTTLPELRRKTAGR